MKQVKRIGKRATSAFMAFAIAFVAVVTVAGGVFIAKSLAAPSQTILQLPINNGDHASSPNSVESYWGTATIDGSGCLADSGTSHFYRLQLGDGKTYGDAYCGNYGLHASGNKRYEVSEVIAGKTKVGNMTISKATYNIIRSVVSINIPF